jgi:hypothetical protein
MTPVSTPSVLQGRIRVPPRGAFNLWSSEAVEPRTCTFPSPLAGVKDRPLT